MKALDATTPRYAECAALTLRTTHSIYSGQEGFVGALDPS